MVTSSNNSTGNRTNDNSSDRGVSDRDVHSDGGHGAGTSGATDGVIDSDEFRRVLRCYPTGVTIVTAACPNGPEGVTIGSFASVSLDPALVSFCPGHGSDTWSRMRQVGSFCVNVLGADQADLSTAFSSKSGDRFKGVSTRVEVTGAPVIEGCLAWIDCRIYAIYNAGDHDIVVGRVVALDVGDVSAEDTAGPLIFFEGGYRRITAL